MEALSVLQALRCAGNLPVTGENHKIQRHVSLIYAWTIDRRQAIIWTNADPIHRRIYAALRGDELTVSIILFHNFVHLESIHYTPNKRY